MAYIVVSGEIQVGLLYYVTGDQSVVYNSTIHIPGQYFRGVSNINTFSYSGSGTQIVTEISELMAVSVELLQSPIEQPTFNDYITLRGGGIGYELNDDEKIINEVTAIKGFALELIDYPFFAFEIIEIRI